MTPTGHEMVDVCIGPTPVITWSLTLLDTGLLYQVLVNKSLSWGT